MKNVKEFLDGIFNLKRDAIKYYTFGYQEEYRKKVNYDYGYVPFVTGLDFEEVVDIIPLTNPNNRCGIKKTSTEYVVVHDTASGAPTANAKAHQNWLNSMANDPKSTTCVSWHYTVDDNSIRQHLPDDEVGYHAGDGTKVPLEFSKTNVKYDKNNTNITITEDGYFQINGITTSLKAPTNDKGEIVKTSDLPSQGVNFIIDENGNYCLGNMYWNSGFKTLSNRGGNLNSVGIETCVNYGGSYTDTMRINAYLVAKLLIKYNLGLDRVKQHNSFSGKNCPMTMRVNNRWDEFLELVQINLDYLNNFKDLKIVFKSLTKDYLDDAGHLSEKAAGNVVSYEVNVCNKNKNADCINEKFVYEFKVGRINFSKDEE